MSTKSPAKPKRHTAANCFKGQHEKGDREWCKYCGTPMREQSSTTSLATLAARLRKHAAAFTTARADGCVLRGDLILSADALDAADAMAEALKRINKTIDAAQPGAVILVRCIATNARDKWERKP